MPCLPGTWWCRRPGENPPPPPRKEVVEVSPAPVAEKETAGLGTGRIVTSTLLAALGAGGVAVGTIYGLKAKSETEAAREPCVGGPAGNVCNRGSDQPNFDGGFAERDERRDHVEKSDRAALFAYVGWGAAAAGFVGSAIVLLTAPSEGEERAEAAGESASLRVEPVVGVDFVGTAVHGAF